MKMQNDHMNFSYARMQIIRQPTTTKDEGCRVDTNEGYTIPIRYIRK